MINFNHEDPKSVYFIILLLQLLDPCVKSLFFFTFLHQTNKILKSSMKMIGISPGKVGKVTGISEEITVESLLHVLFLLSAHAMAYTELRKDSANWVGSDIWATKRLCSLKTQQVCFSTQRSRFPKNVLFYTFQHLGIVRESQEALESRITCSNTKKANRKRTVVFSAEANASCLIYSSENLQIHQAISVGQRFCMSLSNVPKK